MRVLASENTVRFRSEKDNGKSQNLKRVLNVSKWLSLYSPILTIEFFTLAILMEDL
jgi:hypothetical protein